MTEATENQSWGKAMLVSIFRISIRLQDTVLISPVPVMLSQAWLELQVWLFNIHFCDCIQQKFYISLVAKQPPHEYSADM